MSANSELTRDMKLLGRYLSPSWLSTLIEILAVLTLVIGTIVLAHFGSVLREGLLGLNDAYNQSSVSIIVQQITHHFTANSAVQASAFYLFWAMVGLVVYLIVIAIMNQTKKVDELAHKLNYVHVSRRQLLLSVVTQALIRGIALIGWVLCLRLFFYQLLPHALATVYTTAFHLADVISWVDSVVLAIACGLALHILVILLRLALLRPRLLSDGIF